MRATSGCVTEVSSFHRKGIGNNSLLETETVHWWSTNREEESVVCLSRVCPGDLHCLLQTVVYHHLLCVIMKLVVSEKIPEALLSFSGVLLLCVTQTESKREKYWTKGREVTSFVILCTEKSLTRKVCERPGVSWLIREMCHLRNMKSPLRWYLPEESRRKKAYNLLLVLPQCRCLLESLGVVFFISFPLSF